MLIDELRIIQEQHGWLPEEEIRAFCERSGTPLYQVQAVASFYPHFHLKPPPAREILVCTDLACRLRGAEEILESLKRAAQNGDTGVHACSCLGQCDRAPAMLVDGVPAKAGPRLPGEVVEPLPAAAHRLEIDPYAGESSYSALQALVQQKDSAVDLIGRLKESSLRGMGGAGFPAGVKWELVRAAPGDRKFAVCNADESEPGTFKDRHILECAPHLVLEGLLLGAAAVGAREAILYLRHEYPGPRRAFLAELQRARSLNLLPEDLEVRLFDSPGGYICGEEMALLEALEGKRAEPRNKPPFPGTHGLWGCPTLINNVETFALAAAIAVRGSDWFRQQGEGPGIGPKFIGISGDIRRPGVYQTPLGIPLRRFIEDQGGGPPEGRRIKAVCPGGASSGLLPPELLDTPLEFRALSTIGSMLGSGAVIVLDESRCILDTALNLVRFFRNESCGKCVPCRAGSEKLTAIMESWRAGRGSESDLPLVHELAAAMADASICGLGQIAPAPLISALKYWPDEVLGHLAGGPCPAGVCPR